MTNLRDILPPEVEQWQGGEVSAEEVIIANHMRRKCLKALEQALKDGVICFVPTKADILFCLNDEAKKHILEELTDYHRADAIIQLLKNQKDINV